LPMTPPPLSNLRMALLGFGNVGRALIDYLARSDLGIRVGAVADSSGGLLLGSGDDLQNIVAQKQAGTSLGQFAGERCIRDAAEFIRMLPAAGIPVLVESLPTNIRDGQPALDLIKLALEQGTSVVTVDKGPLVHGFEELTQTARERGAGLAYSGTTGVRPPDTLAALGAQALGPHPRLAAASCLPDSGLPASRVLEIRGILNGTTNYILTEMQQGALSFQEALARAISDGVAEPDPSLDVDGWDTACKILILAKSLMGADARLDQVSRIGIGPETESLINVGRSTGRIVRLAGRARIWQSRVRVSVAPKLVGPDSIFFSVSGTSKAAIFRTAEHGEVIVHSSSGRDSISEVIVDDILKLAGQTRMEQG
jgi:homoserine dehydrogenase